MKKILITDEEIIQAINYYDRKCVMDVNRGYNPLFLEYPFIPIFEINEVIYIHVGSLVAYCHIHDPARFHKLTHPSVCRLITETRQITENRATYQFRVLPRHRFLEMLETAESHE